MLGRETPDAPCTGAFSSAGDRAMIHTARSRHPGGVNVLLGDGSVQFINQSITLANWQALCTPRGGEVVSGVY